MQPTNHLFCDALERLQQGRHHDPFSVLGRHEIGNDQERLLVFRPDANRIHIANTHLHLDPLNLHGFFVWEGPCGQIPSDYYLCADGPNGAQWTFNDPYRFGSQISDFDRHLFSEGRHWHAQQFLGAHSLVVDHISGIRFSTWSPNAERVSVVGNFNQWDGRTHPMRVHPDSGIWEIFIPDLPCGELYRFEIRQRNSGQVSLKIDPYGRQFEHRPSTASITTDTDHYPWQDHLWMEQRAQQNWLQSPMSVYEVHLGSWQRGDHNEFLNYVTLAERLVQHCQHLGFTHIELLPITEHPLDDSWGYQTTGYYAPTSRFGCADDFRRFVDIFHQHHIGVLLDWVPAHFPKDAHALAQFDGDPLYEHADPRRGEHRDWGTLIFDYGRNEVKNFLVSNALYWLQVFHIDGLRVDAVASMLYLNYSRDDGDWLPNEHGGHENLQAMTFLRELNQLTHDQAPGTLILAEESTAWPMVSRPVYLGGLGFSLKWNMGWMNDTLSYLHNEPVHRSYSHDKLTFGQLYAYTENFLLPLSHDEVVHGKGSLINKMPGDEWQQFANLRLLYLWQYTHPGRKLIFMGGEFGQRREWDCNHPLDWHLLEQPQHQKTLQFVADLNHVYRDQSALYQYDFEPCGFNWIDCHDVQQSVVVFSRHSDHDYLVIILNFTPVVRHQYRIGVPEPGQYQELFNSDNTLYGGSHITHPDPLHTETQPWMNRDHSLTLNLPPLGGVILKKI